MILNVQHLNFFIYDQLWDFYLLGFTFILLHFYNYLDLIILNKL